MEVILTFDPATEFEAIGEIFEFQEEVQRPEELRFFTLDEQLLDYQSKVLSTKTKITSYERNQISYELDRIRNTYNRLIAFKDGYKVEDERKKIGVPWITPIYSDFEYVPYSYSENWLPLMDKSQRNTPNFYDRILKALPRPFKNTEQKGIPVAEKTFLVNEEGEKGIQALGLYHRTKGIVHEDGSFSVEKIPVGNTEDDIRIKGYHLGNRGVDIPNPLADHPFLASVNPSKILTDEKLEDIFPSITAILNHGVPTTTDPYVEGTKFLKIYDVSLSQIPWKSWKERFPPVDTISASPKIVSISFPDGSEQQTPSESLRKNYTLPWYPSVHSRLWLMKQEDSGTTLIKLLLSKVGDAGTTSPEIVGEKLTQQYPASTPEECLVTDNFDSFLNSGVYRSGTCVPADSIQSERKTMLTAGKMPWRETVVTEVVDDHIKLLKTFQTSAKREKAPKYEKIVGKPESDLQRDIVTLLNDPQRTPTDKADAIQTILNMVMPVNQQYFDKDESFLICSHTIAELRGDLEENRLEFYSKWSTIDEGARVCKYCGEEINKDVLVAQDEFDSQGKLIVNYDVLETTGFQGQQSISSVTNSLKELRTKLFDLENAGESTLYLLLSLLQVVPNETFLIPVLQYIRKLSTLLRGRKGVEKAVRERAEGVLGLVGAIVILQTHDPFLIPRATFGIKLFKLSGYPRDSADPNESPILDNLIAGLRAVFKESPNTFKGSVVPLFRAIISSPKDVRKETTRYLANALVEFKVFFESAKERYIEPTPQEETNNLYFTLIKVDKTEYKPNQTMGTEELMMRCDVPKPKSILTGRLPPKVSQDAIELEKNITKARQGFFVQPEVVDLESILFNEKDIRRRLKIGLTKLVKGDKIEKFLKLETIDAISILTLMNRVLDILAIQKFDFQKIEVYRRYTTFLQTRLNSSLLRDVAKGLLYELFEDASKDKNVSSIKKALDEAVNRDIVLNMIFFTKEEAERITDAARTQERDAFKKRLRSMNDTERELTKLLLDIGIAPYIITNEDREMFAREYNYPDPEEEYERIMNQQDETIPEGGNETRDYVEAGDTPLNVNGEEMQVDYGDYGDRAVRPYDDYSNTMGDADFDEGYGI